MVVGYGGLFSFAYVAVGLHTQSSVNNHPTAVGGARVVDETALLKEQDGVGDVLAICVSVAYGIECHRRLLWLGERGSGGTETVEADLDHQLLEPVQVLLAHHARDVFFDRRASLFHDLGNRRVIVPVPQSADHGVPLHTSGRAPSSTRSAP